MASVWPQPPRVTERKGAARGCCRGSWLEVSGVHWVKAREPLRSNPPQKPVVAGDSRV